MKHRHDSEEFRKLAEAGTILRCLAGSGAHGLSVSGQDDRDEMGVCTEPPEYVIGLRQFEQYEHHTAWERPGGRANRSGPGDLDITIYSLRKYLRLALAGNPTILLPLYVPDEHVTVITGLGRELRRLAPLIISKQAGHRFLGYLDAQRRSLLSRDGKGRDVTRPELVARYGFDCYLDDTEFLTRRGWLRYDDIEDEPLATVNPATGQAEFQRPTERVARPYSGPILHSKTRYGTWAVTPNHRMWVSKADRGPSGRNGSGYEPDRAAWEFRRADDLTRLVWHQQVAALPRQDEFPVEDAYLALVGAYAAEGCVAKRAAGEPSVLRFEQKDGGRLHEVMAVIGARWPLWSYRYEEKRPVTLWTLADRQVARDVAKACGEGSHNKRLPGWVFDLSARQADQLLWALMAGDGTPYRAGGWIYYTISRGLAGDVQALAVLAGRRSNMWGPYEGGMYQVLVQDRGRQIGTLHSRSVLAEHVTGARIVCFTMPNETLITRRNGRVAMHGNTKFCAHMVRLGWQGTELLRDGFLTLPVREDKRQWLVELRTGQHTLDEALKIAGEAERQIRELLVTSPLPEHPDYETANAWLVSAYQRAWKMSGDIRD